MSEIDEIKRAILNRAPDASGMLTAALAYSAEPAAYAVAELVHTFRLLANYHDDRLANLRRLIDDKSTPHEVIRSAYLVRTDPIAIARSARADAAEILAGVTDFASGVPAAIEALAAVYERSRQASAACAEAINAANTVAALARPRFPTAFKAAA